MNKNLILKITWPLALLLHTYSFAKCDSYDLSSRASQFHLPFVGTATVDESWFSMRTRKELYMWDSDIFHKTQIDHLKSKNGVSSFEMKIKINKKYASVKVNFLYGDGTKFAITQNWICNEDKWLLD